MFVIRQNGSVWELVHDGQVLSAHAGEGGYDSALRELGGLLTIERAQLAMDGGGEAGLLPERWVAPIAWESAPTGDGRDFTDCAWSWRDPDESLIPLMLHTETDMGHFGAQLAGFATSIDNPTGAGVMRGRFYDSDEGRTFRDMLLDGRRYGVSVDPGAVEIEFRCTETDEDGFCIDEDLVFLAYEVIGLTGTPFPGFARAHIVLDTAPVESEAAPPAPAPAAASSTAALSAAEPCCDACAASAARRAAGAPLRGVQPVLTAASALRRPPRSWFDNPQLARLSAPRYEDDGRAYGHLAPWGQCHTGFQGECVMTPRSLTNYSYFQTGYVVCDDGSEVAVGQLTIGGGHAEQHLSYRGAIEHYDNVATAFADVAVGEDEHGIWFAGALRHNCTEAMLADARAFPPSGDWRPVGRGSELVAACAVVSQGLPIARVASSGRLTLVAAGAPVMRALARHELDGDGDRLARVERQLAELRAEATAPARARLQAVARAHARDRLLKV